MTGRTVSLPAPYLLPACSLRSAAALGLGSLGLSLLVALSAPAATADPIPYPNVGTIAPTQPLSLMGTGQDVEAYFGGTGASFSEQVGMYVNGILSPAGFVFPDHDTPNGAAVNLGFVPAGTDIVFGLQVWDSDLGNSPTGTALNSGGNLNYTGTPSYTLYSVPSDDAYGFANPDGVNHAYITPFTSSDVSTTFPVTGIYVGFEDKQVPGSDLNYQDGQYVFSGVALGVAPPLGPAVPEPSSVVLLSLALPALGLMVRRRARR